MAWRFVKQPNGLLARFSDVVDDFTHYNMTHQEALEVCKNERGLSDEDAREKIQRGVEDWKPWTNGVKGGGLDRWLDSLDAIRRVHGDKRAHEVELELGSPESANIDEDTAISPPAN